MGENVIKSDGTFSFFIPLKKGKDSGDEKRIIEGIASTEQRDLQNEEVLQRGIDINYFLKRGKLNWDHKSGPENIIGEPLDCKHTDKGLYVKGMLYKSHPRAQATWDLANAMEKSGSNHGLGFSIQGKVVRKGVGDDGQGVIESCWLQEIAVTAHPINQNTYMDIVKALNSEHWVSDPAETHPIPEPVEAEKSLETSDDSSTELPLEEEFLDKGLDNSHSYACRCVKCKHDSISKSQAVDYIKTNYDVSDEVARILADSAFMMTELV